LEKSAENFFREANVQEFSILSSGFENLPAETGELWAEKFLEEREREKFETDWGEREAKEDYI